MVLIREFRCSVPLSSSAYLRGFLYSLNKYRQLNEQKNRLSTPKLIFDSSNEKIFSLKNYRLISLLPPWLDRFVDSSSLVVESHSWIDDRRIRTFYSIPKFLGRVVFSMDSKIFSEEEFAKENENPLNLSSAELKVRSLHSSLDQIKNEEKTKFLTICTVLRVSVAVFPLINQRAENFIMNELIEIYSNLQKYLIDWSSEWSSLTLRKILENEIQTTKGEFIEESKEIPKPPENFSIENIQTLIENKRINNQNSKSQNFTNFLRSKI